MKSHYFGLDDNHEIYPVKDLIEVEKILRDFSRRIIGKTEVGNMEVSTVFLGVDHRFIEEGAPLLFETMIFGGPENGSYQTRCCTYQEALEMHEQGIKHAKELMK